MRSPENALNVEALLQLAKRNRWDLEMADLDEKLLNSAKQLFPEMSEYTLSSYCRSVINKMKMSA